jgi:hypothetical protein
MHSTSRTMRLAVSCVVSRGLARCGQAASRTSTQPTLGLAGRAGGLVPGMAGDLLVLDAPQMAVRTSLGRGDGASVSVGSLRERALRHVEVIPAKAQRLAPTHAGHEE